MSRTASLLCSTLRNRGGTTFRGFALHCTIMMARHIASLLGLCLLAGCQARELQLFVPIQDNGAQAEEEQGGDIEPDPVPDRGIDGSTGEAVVADAGGAGERGADADAMAEAEDAGGQETDGGEPSAVCAIAPGLYQGEFSCIVDELLTVRGEINFTVSEEVTMTTEMVDFEEGANVIQRFLPAPENDPDPGAVSETLAIHGGAGCSGFYATTDALNVDELPMLAALLARFLADLTSLTTIHTKFTGEWDEDDPELVSGAIESFSPLMCEECKPFCMGTWFARLTQ